MNSPDSSRFPDSEMLGFAPVACVHTGWAILRATGADALAFLHGQLSCDVTALAAGEGRYWSFNTPKGRMLANGVLWRNPSDAPDAEVTLLLAVDLAETIRRRLSMFVLRAKVTIDDVTARHALIGVAGRGSVEAVREAFGAAPPLSRAVGFNDAAIVFRLPDSRLVIVAPTASAPIVQAALVRHASTIDADAWEWFGVMAGVPWLTAATSDLFVPQMVNWDLLGGVAFDKGCYPGQEIVARMQYLGRLKERLFAFHVDSHAVARATRLYSATFGAEQPCGTVVNAASDPRGGSVLIAVARREAVDADDLRLGAPDGPALARRPLPYPVPAPAVR
jgi:folate-binding protein YgfZ